MNLEERLVKMLLDRNEKVSTAESCTGGLVAGKIVNVSGASEVFDEGYVTYANKSKAKLLGVSKEILDNEGAECVWLSLLSDACSPFMGQNTFRRTA